MQKLSRDSWIEAGLRMLDESGHVQLSAEKIARRLNVTRGSFYHHFRNRSDWVQAILLRWQTEYTDDVIAYADAVPDPGLRLERYLQVAGRLQPGREVAIRTWAAKDQAVLAALAAVDARRLAFAERLGHALFPEARASDVQRFARIACLTFIGFQQTGPYGRERFGELIEDVLALASLDGRLPTGASAAPIAPRPVGAAPARTPRSAGRPG